MKRIAPLGRNTPSEEPCTEQKLENMNTTIYIFHRKAQYFIIQWQSYFCLASNKKLYELNQQYEKFGN